MENQKRESTSKTPNLRNVSRRTTEEEYIMLALIVVGKGVAAVVGVVVVVKKSLSKHTHRSQDQINTGYRPLRAEPYKKVNSRWWWR